MRRRAAFSVLFVAMLRASTLLRLRLRELGRSAVVVRFPPRRIRAVVICRERDGDGWLTLAGAHGWLFGSLADARTEAHWLSRNLNLPIVEHVS